MALSQSIKINMNKIHILWQDSNKTCWISLLLNGKKLRGEKKQIFYLHTKWMSPKHSSSSGEKSDLYLALSNLMYFWIRWLDVIGNRNRSGQWPLQLQCVVHSLVKNFEWMLRLLKPWQNRNGRKWKEMLDRKCSL